MTASKPPAEGTPSIHDQIIRCVEQAGHPDWSLREMVNRLKEIAKDARQLERELQAERQRCEEAENIGADKLLAELTRRGINTENWDGDEGLWPTLARCIASAIHAERDGTVSVPARKLLEKGLSAYGAGCVDGWNQCRQTMFVEQEIEMIIQQKMKGETDGR